MSDYDILVQAKKLIEDRDWCQGAYSIGQNGKNRKYLYEIFPNDVKFCVVGALSQVQNTQCEANIHHIFCEANNLGTWTIIQWNDADGRTKEEVLTAFDRAIAVAGATS